MFSPIRTYKSYFCKKKVSMCRICNHFLNNNENYHNFERNEVPATIATQKVISTVINLKNCFPLLKGSDLEKKQKRSCSYIAVYVSMIPGITRSSCFSRERASHMQSSFQDEMSFRVVRGVISICFHPLLLKIRNENELLYMVYLLHIS